MGEAWLMEIHLASCGEEAMTVSVADNSKWRKDSGLRASLVCLANNHSNRLDPT